MKAVATTIGTLTDMERWSIVLKMVQMVNTRANGLDLRDLDKRSLRLVILPQMEYGKTISVILSDQFDFLAHGKQIFTTKTKEIYEGQFIEQKRHGTGALTWPNGDSYYGDFENGLMHGKGNLKMAEGMEYEGTFSYGEKHGEENDFTLQGHSP